MKSFLKVLGINLLVGLLFIMLVTFVINGELAEPMAYVGYMLTTFLMPSIVSAALVKGLLLKEKAVVLSKSRKK